MSAVTNISSDNNRNQGDIHSDVGGNEADPLLGVGFSPTIRKRKRTTSPPNRPDHPDQVAGTGNPSSLSSSSSPPSLTPGPLEPKGPLSKNQQKKLLKREKWEASRETRRAQRREKTALKRARQRDARAAVATTDTPVSDRSQCNIPSAPVEFRPKRKHVRKLERLSKSVPVRCIIDCSFDDYMLDKEIASLGSQVSRCYSENRVARVSMDLWITCLDKRLEQHMNLMHGDKWKSWRKIHITHTGYEVPDEDVKVGNVIYLSSDSDHTLAELEDHKTYIIGGIVDKNRHKGLCFNKATGQNLQTAKLPIGDFIKMSGRITLTTNQVVEIMLKWLEFKDWKVAFNLVIPMRKKREPEAGESLDKPSLREDAPEGFLNIELESSHLVSQDASDSRGK